MTDIENKTSLIEDNTEIVEPVAEDKPKAIQDFDKVMDEYNEARTKPDLTEKQLADIDKKYEPIIAKAEEKMEKELEKKIEQDNADLEKEQEDVVGGYEAKAIEDEKKFLAKQEAKQEAKDKKRDEVAEKQEEHLVDLTSQKILKEITKGVDHKKIAKSYTEDQIIQAGATLGIKLSKKNTEVESIEKIEKHLSSKK